MFGQLRALKQTSFAGNDDPLQRCYRSPTLSVHRDTRLRDLCHCSTPHY